MATSLSTSSADTKPSPTKLFCHWLETGELSDQTLSTDQQGKLLMTYISDLSTEGRIRNNKNGYYNYKRENVALAVAHFEKASQSDRFKLFNGKIMDQLRAQLQSAAWQVHIPLPLSLRNITSACPIR